MLTKNQIILIQETIPVLRESGTALTAYFYNRMLNNHPELRNIFNLNHQQSGNQAKALAHAVLAYAENIENLGDLGDNVALMAAKHVSLNIQPEQYSIVGENLLCSISEVLGVSMESELIQAWNVAYQQLADILISAEKSLYEQNLAKKGGWVGWREFIIDKKIKENEEVVSFYLIPKDQKILPEYLPGQYISLCILIPELGIKQPRQYTLSQSYNDKQYRISVKRESKNKQIENLSVSNTLHDYFNEGDIVELSHPTGNFYLQKPLKKNVFISAGVGITPMLAMLDYLSAISSQQHISFIHASRNDKVLSLEMIEPFRKTLPQLKTYIACEKTDNQINVDKIGRLDLMELSEDTLPRDADFYICGPIDFMKLQFEQLKSLGIHRDQIYMELFGTGGVNL